MSDLTSKTVEELRAWGFDPDVLGYPELKAFNEVASRLEEAQQKIVAQQARIEEFLKWPRYAGVLIQEDDLSDLAAHDAEVAAKAMEEAKEIVMQRNERWQLNRQNTIDAIEAMAAEYRAKAGRKE